MARQKQESAINGENAQPKSVRFLVDHFQFGQVKYAAGETYPATEETLREAAKGNAVLE